MGPQILRRKRVTNRALDPTTPYGLRGTGDGATKYKRTDGSIPKNDSEKCRGIVVGCYPVFFGCTYERPDNDA